MAAEIAMMSLRVSKWQTKPMRLILVSLSSLEKPRPLLKLVRTTSPSRISTLRPAAFRRFSKILAMVDLPAPDNPVNQMVTPVDIKLSSYLILNKRVRNAVQNQKPKEKKK